MPKIPPDDDAPELEDSKPRSVVDVIPDLYSPSALPIAPDGGIAPGSFAEGALPQQRLSLCKQGPCRYLWTIRTPFDAAVGPEVYRELGHKPPEQEILTCTANPGCETELTNDLPIIACDRWEPKTSYELAEQERRRKEYRERASAAESRNDPVVEEGEEDASRQHDDGIDRQ